MKNKKQIIAETVNKFLKEDVDNSPITDNPDYFWFYFKEDRWADTFDESELYDICKKWYPNDEKRIAYGLPMKYKNRINSNKIEPLDLSTLR